MKGSITLLCLFVAFAFSSIAQKRLPKVLVFSKAAGFYHKSIPAGVKAVQQIGLEKKFTVDTTSDASLFTDKNLKQYAALIFMSTTGNLFDTFQKQALQQYMKKGGGFVGVHAATDAEYNWPWYGQLIGGYFESHPKQQQAKLVVVDASHAATKGLPKEWMRFDEWYNFKNLNPDVHVLVKIDEGSYEGGKNGGNHPMAWWQKFGGGRVFYTALGHTNESYSEPLFIQHLTGGILYAMGK